MEALVGRFVDSAWTYRFGPPTQDVVVADLRDGDPLLARDLRFPAGRPLAREPVARLGLEARARRDGESHLVVDVRTHRVAYGVRVEAGAGVPNDAAFDLPPGRQPSLVVAFPPGQEPPAAVTIRALNGSDRLPVAV